MTWNISYVKTDDTWEVSYGTNTGLVSISVVLKDTKTKRVASNLTKLNVVVRESSDSETIVYETTSGSTNSDGFLEIAWDTIIANTLYYVSVESANGKDIAIFKRLAN